MAITAVVWITVLILTPPESDEVLDRFYAKVRPGGPGWRRQRERTGIPPSQDLALDLKRILAAVLLLYAFMFGIGGLLLQKWGWMIWMTVLAVASGAWLFVLQRRGYVDQTAEV